MLFVSDVDTDQTFYLYHSNFGSFYVVCKPPGCAYLVIPKDLAR